jgi:hypothetical protein
MDKLKILCCHAIFNEPAYVLSQKFKLDVVKGEFDPKDGDIYIVYGAHEVAANLTNFQSNVKVGYIIYNSEPPSSRFMRDKYYISLLKSNPVFDYSQASTDFMKKTLGVNAFSHFFFEFIKAPEVTKVRDIDILFIGTENEERKRIRDRLIERYPDKNIKFIFDWSLKVPAEMKNILCNSKYVLNIPYYNDGALETHRINNALSAGCEVVSHSQTDHDTKMFYDEFIYFTDKVEEFQFFEYEEHKEGYEKLIKKLTTAVTAHNIFVLNNICK